LGAPVADRAETASVSKLTGAAASAALKTIADKMWAEQQLDSPQASTAAGMRLHDDELDDLSPKEGQRSARVIAELGRELAKIDPDALSDQERVTFDSLLKQVTETASREREHYELWAPLSNMNGALEALEECFGNNHTLDTPQAVENLLKRFEQVGRQLDQVAKNLEQGISQGYTPSQAAIDAAVAECQGELPPNAEDSPLLGVLGSLPTTMGADEQAATKAKIIAAFQENVAPAVKRYGAFLKTLTGTQTPGLVGMPNGKGKKIYQREIEIETDGRWTAEDLHKLGLTQVAKTKSQMLELGKKLAPEAKTLPDLLKAVQALADGQPADPAATKKAIDAAVADAERDIAAIWGVKAADNTPLQVNVVSAGPAAYYEPGSIDGKRPGAMFVNASLGIPPLALRNIVYHEYTHHLQDAAAAHGTQPPGVRFNYSDATVEGQAVYTEQLAREQGLFKSDLDVFGSLSDGMLRDARLVVDTGLHEMGWSRQKAIEYMAEHTVMSSAVIESEVDRYISLPAQALSYKVGQLECLRLRDLAQKQLGPAFSLPEFNQVLLQGSTAPLSTLSVLVQRYIDRKKAGGVFG
jgi:uncharacterized protein (DUF885 family)